MRVQSLRLSTSPRGRAEDLWNQARSGAAKETPDQGEHLAGSRGHLLNHLLEPLRERKTHNRTLATLATLGLMSSEGCQRSASSRSTP
eukprot:CAMPEP_0185323890 /NCGR_PEP_ID=MMETSP1363-20130426/62840_1 /TAXON_ID=38817 /ORGANISM="Gephyrocapsa oceanica, Strain RCC1303" /LENGTH=87 /DNA_ID=CAMNT_0027922505 /DNA_START=93 /DNA_END=352 /DNA_ORIENTATION=+